MRRLTGVLVVAMLLAAAGPARAEQAVGLLTGGDVLVTFDSATPGTLTSFRQITGLQPGEHLMGLDFRYIPLTVTPPTSQPPPQLFGLGVIPGANDTIRVYTVDPGTGAATVLSPAGINVTNPGNAYGFDFIPSIDRIRVVNNSDANLRLNPFSGALAATDPTLNPAGHQIAAVAHPGANVPPAGVVNTSTAYAISGATSSLVTIGGINNSPSANSGGVMNIGPLGVTLAMGSAATTNFDIAPGGTAFATLTPQGGVPGLYTLNLATGAATLSGELAAPLRAFTTIPGSTVQFDAANVLQAESGGAAITVARSGSAAGTTTVGYSTSDGTAAAGDYQSTSGTLTFGPNETTKTFAVPIVNDGVDEPDETVNLTLSAPSPPMALGAQATATLTIVDDDAPVTPPPPPTPPDTTDPALAVSGVPKSMSLKAFLKGLKATLTPSEPVSIEAALLGTVKGARISAFNLELASRSLPLGAGARTLTLKPGRRLVGKPRKTFKVRLRVRATDAAGNLGTLTRTVTVKVRR